MSPSGEVAFLRYVYRGGSPMNIVAFSPMDDLLLVAGNDNVVRLFEVARPAGAGLQHEFRHHKDAVSEQAGPCPAGGLSDHLCVDGGGYA